MPALGPKAFDIYVERLYGTVHEISVENWKDDMLFYFKRTCSEHILRTSKSVLTFSKPSSKIFAITQIH